jgi:hypothetical protein
LTISGLMKKGAEWTILCDTELLIVAITPHDKVITSFTTDPKGSILNHLQRIYDIQYKWENNTEKDYHCMNYNKRNVMHRFVGLRKVVYLDPRKQELLKRKRRNNETLGLISMKDLVNFNQRFSALVRSGFQKPTKKNF